MKHIYFVNEKVSSAKNRFCIKIYARQKSSLEFAVVVRNSEMESPNNITGEREMIANRIHVIDVKIQNEKQFQLAKLAKQTERQGIKIEKINQNTL